MERYRIAFDGVHASTDCKRRMADVMLEMNKRPMARTPKNTHAYRMPKSRRALLIAIAAILLLLSACAAYAIYWSSTQRAKENAESILAQPADELQQAAESYADEYLRAVTLSAPLSGSTTVSGVTISMHSVELFQDADGAEYDFRYTVQSDSVGFITSFADDFLSSDHDGQARLTRYETFCELGVDARDFVLTIDGQAFPVYAPPDYEGVKQPASNWNPPDSERAWTSSFMVWKNPFPITQTTKMNLSGTLYACDRSGVRTGALGSFSIDFDYRYPAEAAEKIRQNAIEGYKESQQALQSARLDALDTLPETAVPVGLPLGTSAAVLEDVTFLPDGLLLGFTSDLSALEASKRYIVNAPLEYFLDGYMQHAELIDQSYALDKAMPKNADGNHPMKSASELYKLPYYRNAADMPETVTVCIMEHATEKARLLNESAEYYYPELLTAVFKVNRSSGTVTLPKNDSERSAWLLEHAALASDGRNDNRAYKLSKHARDTIGDVTLWIPEIDYEPQTGVIQLCYWFKNLTCDIMVWETTPTVLLDGQPLSEYRGDAYYHRTGSMDHTFSVNIEEWLSSYDVTKKRDFWECDAFSVPVRFTELPETFTLEVSWDIYDLNDQGERVFVGQFHVTEEIRRDAYQAYDYYDMDRIWSKEVSW